MYNSSPVIIQPLAARW